MTARKRHGVPVHYCSGHLDPDGLSLHEFGYAHAATNTIKAAAVVLCRILFEKACHRVCLRTMTSDPCNKAGRRTVGRIYKHHVVRCPSRCVDGKENDWMAQNAGYGMRRRTGEHQKMAGWPIPGMTLTCLGMFSRPRG